MRVASAECGVPISTTQETLPERERGGVLLCPRSVPDLYRVNSRHTLVLPRRPEWLRVADAHDGAALRGGADGLLHGVRLGLAKFPPAIGAPRVPVPAVRRDLDARDDQWIPAAAHAVGRLMRDVVVIGRAKEVAANGTHRIKHLDRTGVTIREDRMAVQVAADPAGPRGRQRHDVAHTREVLARGRREPRIEPHLDLPVAGARTHLVRPEQHMPTARLDLAFAVGRRGPRLVDGEFHLLAAAPSAESRGALGNSALVKKTDVERVPATER